MGRVKCVGEEKFVHLSKFGQQDYIQKDLIQNRQYFTVIFSGVSCMKDNS